MRTQALATIVIIKLKFKLCHHKLEQRIPDTGMLKDRLREATLKDTSPFVGVSVRFSRFIGGKNAFFLHARVKKGRSKDALQDLLREAKRTIQHGFTASELSRQKASLLRHFEKAATEIDTTKSRVYASKYVRHFIHNVPIIGSEHRYLVGKTFLPEITLDDVNRIGAEWLTHKNNLITISAPDLETLNLPSASEIMMLLASVSKEKLVAYQDEKVADELMNQIPAAGSIVAKTFDETLEIHYWTLSNGAKVMLKKRYANIIEF